MSAMEDGPITTTTIINGLRNQVPILEEETTGQQETVSGATAAYWLESHPQLIHQSGGLSMTCSTTAILSKKPTINPPEGKWQQLPPHYHLVEAATAHPKGKWQQLPPQQHPVVVATAHPTGKWQQLPPQYHLVEAATAHPKGKWQQLPPQQHPVVAATTLPTTNVRFISIISVNNIINIKMFKTLSRTWSATNKGEKQTYENYKWKYQEQHRYSPLESGVRDAGKIRWKNYNWWWMSSILN